MGAPPLRGSEGGRTVFLVAVGADSVQTRMSVKDIGVMIALGAIWGASFMLIKISVVEIPPVILVATRLALASAVLLAILYTRGLRLPGALRSWFDFLVVGTLGLALPFLLISWGQRLIPSGLTAILNAAVPLFSALLAYFWQREERLGAMRTIGLVVGFAGVMMAVGFDSLSAQGETLQGGLAVIAATLCFAIAGHYGRRAFQGMSPLVPATGQLLVGAAVMAPLALLSGAAPAQMPSLGAIAALVTLAVVCTALAYVLVYWLLAQLGATRSSMVTYLIAPFGVVYGALLLGEQIHGAALAGLALVLGGIVIANRPARAAAAAGSP
jgi:drug/metabolite transporter (DMT)-like permease